MAEDACIGGVDWVQLRLKNIPDKEYRKAALAVQAVCKKFGTVLIINDNPQVALAIRADGVHLGKEDMNPLAARKLLGDRFIIGCTANTLDDVIRLSAMPIDYIGLGPLRFTDTKQNLSPVLGMDGYKAIFAALKEQGIKHPPIIGIGGIKEKDVPGLLAAGLHGIAVAAAISAGRDVATAAGKFCKLIAGTDTDAID